MRYIICFSIFLTSISVFAEDITFCKEGWKHTEQGDHNRAIELLKQCIVSGGLSNSLLARTYRNIGIANSRSGHYEKAINSYDQALSYDPSDPWDDYMNRGNAWSSQGEYAKALDDYDKAQSLKPNYNEVFYNRGILFEKQGKIQQAVKEFSKAYKNGLRSELLKERFIVYGLTTDKEEIDPLICTATIFNLAKAAVVMREKGYTKELLTSQFPSYENLLNLKPSKNRFIGLTMYEIVDEVFGYKNLDNRTYPIYRREVCRYSLDGNTAMKPFSEIYPMLVGCNNGEGAKVLECAIKVSKINKNGSN